ncbi:hypothetical protein RHMOL_Rhmol05G0255400 [Rhododendron molle]|uniref:Uncharacterized protein n=1 Tax=Rhododendron molle TaxID=49168 RepID=A0ACC0NT78_RHOML|nr:hypothetical protein RHMOL_Rhmol05G0255400 [Rhododendron molle]
MRLPNGRLGCHRARYCAVSAKHQPQLHLPLFSFRLEDAIHTDWEKKTSELISGSYKNVIAISFSDNKFCIHLQIGKGNAVLTFPTVMKCVQQHKCVEPTAKYFYGSNRCACLMETLIPEC